VRSGEGVSGDAQVTWERVTGMGHVRSGEGVSGDAQVTWERVTGMACDLVMWVVR